VARLANQNAAVRNCLLWPN